MSDCDLALLVQVGQEWAAIVDTEVENTVLIRCFERHAVDGTVGGLRKRGEVETVEWRKHGELELESVVLCREEGSKVIVLVLRNLNLKSLFAR